jgi:hypothetical protein
MQASDATVDCTGPNRLVFAILFVHIIVHNYLSGSEALAGFAGMLGL